MEFILEMFPFPEEVKHYRPTLSKKEKVKERNKGTTKQKTFPKLAITSIHL